MTGLSAFSIPAFVFGQRGRECIICHETSCAIVVYLFSNLEKLSHSSTFFSPLNSELVFLTSLWMRWSCIFFLSGFDFTVPAFAAMKILLRAIDEMRHMTFCTVRYFVGK